MGPRANHLPRPLEMEAGENVTCPTSTESSIATNETDKAPLALRLSIRSCSSPPAYGLPSNAICVTCQMAFQSAFCSDRIIMLIVRPKNVWKCSIPDVFHRRDLPDLVVIAGRAHCYPYTAACPWRCSLSTSRSRAHRPDCRRVHHSNYRATPPNCARRRSFR